MTPWQSEGDRIACEFHETRELPRDLGSPVVIFGADDADAADRELTFATEEPDCDVDWEENFGLKEDM